MRNKIPKSDFDLFSSALKKSLGNSLIQMSLKHQLEIALQSFLCIRMQPSAFEIGNTGIHKCCLECSSTDVSALSYCIPHLWQQKSACPFQLADLIASKCARVSRVQTSILPLFFPGKRAKNRFSLRQPTLNTLLAFSRRRRQPSNEFYCFLLLPSFFYILRARCNVLSNSRECARCPHQSSKQIYILSALKILLWSSDCERRAGKIAEARY